MINTSVLQSLRAPPSLTSPQHDVLTMPSYESTPIPTFKPGWRGGVDLCVGSSPWVVALPPMRVGKFSCIVGDGRPGFHGDDPKKNVYEIHLHADNDQLLRPLEQVQQMALQYAWDTPDVFVQSTKAAENEFQNFQDRARVQRVHGGIILKQSVWSGGVKKSIPLFENGVQVTGTTDIREGDLVRVGASLYGYEVHAESYGFAFRFGPRGVHIIERAEQCGSSSSEPESSS